MPRRPRTSRNLLKLIAVLAAGVMVGAFAVVQISGATGSDPERIELAAGATANGAAAGKTVKAAARKRAGAKGAADKVVRGPRGPRGKPGRSSDAINGLSVDWIGAKEASQRGVGETKVPGIGALRVACDMGRQVMSLVPLERKGTRTVLDYTLFQGEGAAGVSQYTRLFTQDTSAISISLPPNGMITAVMSVEPINGDGGAGPAPASLTLSSEWKVNDPSSEQNFCHIAGQVVKGS